MGTKYRSVPPSTMFPSGLASVTTKEQTTRRTSLKSAIIRIASTSPNIEVFQTNVLQRLVNCVKNYCQTGINIIYCRQVEVLCGYNVFNDYASLYILRTVTLWSLDCQRFLIDSNLKTGCFVFVYLNNKLQPGLIICPKMNQVGVEFTLLDLSYAWKLFTNSLVINLYTEFCWNHDWRLSSILAISNQIYTKFRVIFRRIEIIIRSWTWETISFVNL